MRPPSRVRPAGERGALVAAAHPAAAADEVRRLAAELGVALAEVVPAADTVLVLAADAGGAARLWGRLEALGDVAAPAADRRAVVELAVRYDGVDLPAVARATGLAVDDVVAAHADARYLAEFTGFAPGFAYLTGLPDALHLPRRDTPRARVPAGSVAIADRYSAVYPTASPGGWHLVGTLVAAGTDDGRRRRSGGGGGGGGGGDGVDRRPPALWDPARVPPAVLSPGTPVRFRPVG